MFLKYKTHFNYRPSVLINKAKPQFVMKSIEGIISMIGSIVALVTAVLGIERGIYNILQRRKNSKKTDSDYRALSYKKRKRKRKRKKRKK